MALLAAQKRVSLLPGVDNNRVGRIIGKDQTEQIVRTFHARFTGLKLGGARSARERIAYVFREGKHQADAADVEAFAGDKDRLIEHADRIKAAARVRRGRTAERILVEQIVELPAESTPEQRAKCAQAFVDSWIARGHEAVAVVHVHGDDKDKVQPHLHVEIAARPVDEAGNVDRSDVLWRGRASVYGERKIVAGLVNETCDPKPPYHPGGFRDIGRKEDKPKGRVPTVAFRIDRAETREERVGRRTDLREAHEKKDGDRAIELAGELAALDAPMYAASAEKRAPLHAACEKRREEIEAHKDAGTWKNGRPAPLREQLAVAERRLEQEQSQPDEAREEIAEVERRLDDDPASSPDAVYLNVPRDGRLDRAELARRPGELAGAQSSDREDLKAKASAAETRAKAVEERAAEAESRARSQTEKQMAWLVDAHERAGKPLPDLTTEEGLSQAWAFVRAAAQAGIDHERRRAEEKKRREAAEAERKKDAEAAAADKAARLAANPYRDRPAAELQAAFREEGLGRANALRDSQDRRTTKEIRDDAAQDLADIDKRIAQIREAAELRGFELERQQAAPSQKSKGHSH